MTTIDWNTAAWRKASYSGGQNNCVEVAPVSSAVGVRDTKDRAGGQLAVSRGTWERFVRSL